MYLAGLPAKWFAAAAGARSIAPLAYFFVLHDYQRSRVTVFLDPRATRSAPATHHPVEDRDRLGRALGKGFGQGSQSHLNYLPEPHTDFVFATMARNGACSAAAGAAGVRHRAALGLDRRPARARPLLEPARRRMTATIFFYVAINLLMVMGLAPVVGIPLPFMSHGGSSMMTNMICIGTLMMVDRWSQPAGRRRASPDGQSPLFSRRTIAIWAAPRDSRVRGISRTDA
jgi:rod shape determining protein RodA